MESSYASSILVTGAAGDIGAIGRNLTAMLLAKGHKVRALVRREDERSEGLRRFGAERVAHCADHDASPGRQRYETRGWNRRSQV